MSQKSGKKLRKRPDDEAGICIKVPVIEINNIPIDETTVGNGVEKDSEVNVQEQMGEVEVNGTNENGLKILNEPQEPEKKDDIEKEIISQEQLNKETIADDKKEAVDQQTSKLDTNSTEDVQQKNQDDKDISPDILENQICKADQSDSKADGENELEPLIIETEEVDPELEFDENSDIDSQKSSPIIRCTTRRSQSRNIPTPKTPKVFDCNNDDKVSEYSDKQSVLTAPTSEVTDTESEVSVFKAVTDVYDSNDELTTKTTEDLDPFNSISTKAIVGSDTTRNIELSLYTDGEYELSPFLTQSREKSVGETLKLLTSRRSIKSATRQYSLQNNAKKDYKTLPIYPKRDPIEKLGGTKRKTHSDSPDYSKRFKTETPGLLSYFSSPIENIKNRFTKSEIPSSTPKLTGYKSKNVFDNTNMSKITLNETEDIADRKWCTVM